MQFLLIAYDGTDSDAEKRRMKVRPTHLEKIKPLKRSGAVIFGGAILDDHGKMIGSTILYEFPDRDTLDAQLLDEVYINEGVWKEIKIVPFRLAQLD